LWLINRFGDLVGCSSKTIRRTHAGARRSSILWPVAEVTHGWGVGLLAGVAEKCGAIWAPGWLHSRKGLRSECWGLKDTKVISFVLLDAQCYFSAFLVLIQRLTSDWRSLIHARLHSTTSQPQTINLTHRSFDSLSSF
jgi:hypothetical protein